MAVTAIKSSKVAMYKMVSLPTTTSGTKDSGIKASQISYRAFTTGLNRIGATINSTIVVNRQIKNALVENLKLKDKEFEEDKKRFQKEKEEKNKSVKKGGGFVPILAKAAEKVAGGFLSGLMGLGGALMKFVISQSVLRWIGNPANIEKLVNIVRGIISIVTFLSGFLRDNIVKMFDGLATMLDGKKNIFEKLGGFVTFITGFGAILGASLLLKRPGLVLKGVGWVLKTLYTSLFKSKTRLAKQIASSGARGAAGGGFGAWSAQQGAKGGGGRFGAVAKGVVATAAIAVPMIVGAQMASGPDEFSGSPGSVSGGQGGNSGGGQTGGNQPDTDPRLAFGGVATRPTSAVIGEKGPELRMPLDNSKRMKDSGIKPLSSLGGLLGGNKGNSKQAQKLSDLFMAPFRGIGAGILANISQVVSGMGPAGQALTPILNNIITPVANSFGVPPSLVKSLTSKTKSTGNVKQQGTIKKGDTQKLFGKGKLVNESSKKFKKVGDTSVLGLLSNMVAAVQVIGNKIGGKNNDQVQQTTQQQTSQSDPTNSATGSKVTQTASGKAGTGRMSQVAGTQEGVGVTDNDRNRQTNQLEQNNIDFKDNGQDYKVLINPNNGEYKLFKKEYFGLANQEIMIGGPKGPTKGGENERLLQKVHNYVQSFFVKNAPEKGLLLKYLDQGMIDNYEKSKNKPPAKKASGGWISGPMSGYPVSLDGGGSTSFIGHGTEWVGFKRAAGGSAFVVPFDTPATKNNSGLTGSRMRQAKSGGYAMPTFSVGGALTASRESASQVRKKAPIKPRAAGGVIPDGIGSSWSAGIPLASISTKSGKSYTVAKALAPRFKGFVDELESTGYRIKTIGGYRPDENKNSDGKGPQFAHPYGAAIDINPDTNGPFGTYNTDLPKNVEAIAKKYGLGWGRHFKDAMHFSAMKREYGGGINGKEISRASIMGSKDGDAFAPGTSPSSSDVASSTTTTEAPETMESVLKKLQDSIGGLNSSLGYAPATTSVEQASNAAVQAKDDKAKAAKQATNNATGAAIKAAANAGKSARIQNQPSNSKSVILPGPTSIIPIEVAFASTTSLYQPKVTFG